MHSKKQMLLNIAGFQAGWFSCVLMAAQGTPLYGVVIAIAIVLLHIATSQNRLVIMILLTITTITGSIWDSMLINLGIFEFQNGQLGEKIVPLWIMAMWLLFATTLNVSLRWLYNRFWLAVAIGAVAGPLAYQGGAALGGVNITGGLTANIIIATGWAFILPALMHLTQSLERNKMMRLT